MSEIEGVDEVIILVKASPQISQKYGETVCCAGLTFSGEWLRLYPVTFRRLEDAKKFGRWDHIRFYWRRPKGDPRPESRRVDQQSIEIIRRLSTRDIQQLLHKVEVTGLKALKDEGKSFALLRPANPIFIIERKSSDEIAQEKNDFDSIGKQEDMFYQEILLPLEPCPYKFKYRSKCRIGVSH